MEFPRISSFCDIILKSNKLLPHSIDYDQFIIELDEIPNLLANSSLSYFDKLNSLVSSGLFQAFDIIFRNNEIINDSQQIKFLKFWDFIFQSCNKEEEINILFENNLVNDLIMFRFDFNSIEVVQSLLTVLKGLSLKTKLINPNLLYTNDFKFCPLLTRSIPFIVYPDSIVISAARFILLNLCLIKDVNMQILLNSNDVYNYIGKLISNMDIDEMAFIADLLDVSSLSLKDFILEKIKEVLLQCDFFNFSKIVSNLSNSIVKSTIMLVISNRMNNFQINSVFSLSLLFYLLNHHLILYDTALENGLIYYQEIPSFSNCKNKKIIPKNNFKNDIYNILSKPSSIESFYLGLQIISILEPNSSFIKEINNKLIETLRNFDKTEILMKYLLDKIPRQRFEGFNYYYNFKTENSTN